MDSPNPAFNDQPVLEGVPSEAGAPLEEEIPIGGPSNVNEIGGGVLSGVVAALILPPRPANIESSRTRPLNWVLLSTYVPSHERVNSLTGMVASDLKGAWEIIHRWSPFNQAEPLVVHMRDLYPNYFRVLVAARVEQYSIPFSVYINKEAFQLVAEDGCILVNMTFTNRPSWYVLIFST